MEELPNNKAKRNVYFWGTVFLASFLATLIAYIGMGDNFAFLALFPPAWIVGILLIVSPFFFLKSLLEKKGRNSSWILLLPGGLFCWRAGSSLSLNLVGDPIPFLIFLYTGTSLLVAFAIVFKAIRRKSLSWKITIILFSIAFGFGFAAEWNSEWHSTIRQEDSLRFDSAVRCTEETRFDSMAKAIDYPDKVCSLGLYDENITEVPPEVAKFKNLKELYLFDMPIADLPAFIGTLKKLEKINIRSRVLRKIPQVYCELPNLQEVSFWGTQVKKDDLMSLYIAFPNIAVGYVGISELQPIETIKGWEEYGIPSLCEK